MRERSVRFDSVLGPELACTLAFALCTILIGMSIGAPLATPRLSALQFASVHYFVPVVAAVAWTVVVLRAGADQLAYALCALLCYAAVIFFHFNLKLWIQFIHPVSLDAAYFWVDEQLWPIVDGAMAIRDEWLDFYPGIDQLYLHVFIGFFYCSLIGHAVFARHSFQQVFFAALLLQILGSFVYLAAPAVGPFIYERGPNEIATLAQNHMLAAYLGMFEQGPDWLAEHGSAHFVSGLAAMPSLHAGGAWLFLVYAKRHLPWLLIGYVPGFAFILLEAIATRWHYIVDLPIGVLLATACIYISDRVKRNTPVAARAPHAMVEHAA